MSLWRSKMKRTMEKLLVTMSQNNKKLNLWKLESDEHGNLLLDPTNSSHREWLENDDDYEVILDKKKNPV